MSRVHEATVRIREAAPERHSTAEIFAVLLFGNHLRHDPKNPHWPARDRLIIASEALRPAWFATLQARGLLTPEDHEQHRSRGFKIHDRHHRSFASAVHGAVEEAKTIMAQKLPAHVYLIIDGPDHRKGELWEAANRASHHGLRNLTCIADCDIALLEDVSPAPHFTKRWESFGWEPLEVDGHNVEELTHAIELGKQTPKPVAIIAYTKGSR